MSDDFVLEVHHAWVEGQRMVQEDLGSRMANFGPARAVATERDGLWN